MKPLLFGAVLGALWLLLGQPLALPTRAVAVLCQPVILAFAAGLASRPYMPKPGRWTR
ncbi:hypothetical protein ABZ299_12520 [Streptomyces sp. NPDC006184]|uniref:hypothetical protein n=1 Tax=Streptomyces sp. NPDC006184 TaxID=3155455 RepID=UPI0033A13EC2